MGKFVLRNCYIEIDTVDISNHVKSVEVTMSKEPVDSTTFGGGGNKSKTHGLSEDKFTITFTQDFAASNVHSILQNLYATEDTADIKVRPTSAAKSATNPSFEAPCKLFEYVPLTGDVGSLAEVEAEFMAEDTPISAVIA